MDVIRGIVGRLCGLVASLVGSDLQVMEFLVGEGKMDFEMGPCVFRKWSGNMPVEKIRL